MITSCCAVPLIVEIGVFDHEHDTNANASSQLQEQTPSTHIARWVEWKLRDSAVLELLAGRVFEK
jgi:hypothetical protein